MKVKLGVVSPDTAVVRSIDDLKGKTLIVVKGTTAETYFEKNEPDVKLQKYDEYADAYNALLQGRGDAFATDNTEVLAWAIVNPGYTVGIDALGNADTIAPAVQKGNTSLLNWLNDEIKSLGNENNRFTQKGCVSRYRGCPHSIGIGWITGYVDQMKEEYNL